IGRQWILIGLSLIFYGWWDVRFVALPVAQIAATWLLARVHERLQSRAPLIIGVALNLLSLGTFKYLDFLLASIEAASGMTLPRANIILPIGISFFSFQLISYLVDRMRGNAPSIHFVRSHCSCCSIRTSSPAQSFVTTSWCPNSPLT